MKLLRQYPENHVSDRDIFNSCSGTDVKKFLQGVCTNDVNKLKNHGDCIAAAFLTPKVIINCCQTFQLFLLKGENLTTENYN